MSSFNQHTKETLIRPADQDVSDKWDRDGPFSSDVVIVDSVVNIHVVDDSGKFNNDHQGRNTEHRKPCAGRISTCRPKT